MKEPPYPVYFGDGQTAAWSDVLSVMAVREVTFIGEQHDDPAAHEIELFLLQNLSAKHWVLSLEMFESDVQTVLDEYLLGHITEAHFLQSARPWKNYQSDYRPLVEWARDHALPVVAANAPRRYVNMVSRLGAASLLHLSERAKTSLPPLPYAAASPRYAEKFHGVMASVNENTVVQSSPKDRSTQNPRLQAQSLWDASMAWSIAENLRRVEKLSVLHVNGKFHSDHKLGILDHLAIYRPSTSNCVISINPSADSKFDSVTMRDLGDFVIVTPPVG